jgi:hypothetical protein
LKCPRCETGYVRPELAVDEENNCLKIVSVECCRCGLIFNPRYW